jgi:peptidoglycan/xylan/chitin deacetylase (PgdA/CDA1 family)
MRLSKFNYLFQNRALVLMYHRIFTPLSDPWNICVSPGNFDAQLNFLKENYSVISTSELVRQLETGKIKNRSVILTFDDGYLDNYTTAKPLLETYSVPATFFITDSYLGGTHSFWWDELENIIVHSNKLPPVFTVQFKGEAITLDLEGEEILNDDLRLQHAVYNANTPPTRRTKLYILLWRMFSPLLRSDQIELLQIIREWAGLKEEETRVEGAMAPEQLKQMADNPLFTIGGHTKTHPSLPDHPEEVQQREISENQRYLEQCIQKKVDLFAYPSGNYNDSTIRILKDQQFSAAFATRQKCVFKNTGIFEISRQQVINWNREEFERAIYKWFR